MTKKKSGAQQRAWKRLNKNPAKRGRPKGETELIEARRGMIELDFLWLVTHGGVDIGEQRWSDLKIVNELLLDDLTRWEKYKLGKCQYRKVHKETLRRLITVARNKFYEAKTPLRVRT